MQALALVALLSTMSVLGAQERLTLESSPGRVTLLELYTSEGCSSCPPADRWLSRMVKDKRLWREVVPVAFHVDYWDYIGWKDGFADPRFGQRQRQFARQGWVRSVYTPGLVVGGREWRGWFRRPELTLEQVPEVGPLRLDIESGRIDVRYQPKSIPAGPLETHVAILGFGIETNVKAGENEGRKLEHDFVVLGYQRAALVRDGDTFVARVKRPSPLHPAPRLAIAGWVNSLGDLRPIQSVGGWLPL